MANTPSRKIQLWQLIVAIGILFLAALNYFKGCNLVVNDPVIDNGETIDSLLLNDTQKNKSDSKNVIVYISGHGFYSRRPIDSLEVRMNMMNVEIGRIDLNGSSLNENEIRYFHRSDLEAAKKIRSVFLEVLKNIGSQNTVNIQPLFNVEAPEGQLEIIVHY